jgi:hypothetical protein
VISLKSELKKLQRRGKGSRAKATSGAPGDSDGGDNDNDDDNDNDENLTRLVQIAGQQFAVLYCAWVDDRLVDDLGFIRPQINPLDGRMRYASAESEVLALQAEMWDLLAKHRKIRERLGVDGTIANDVGFC